MSIWNRWRTQVWAVRIRGEDADRRRPLCHVSAVPLCRVFEGSHTLPVYVWAWNPSPGRATRLASTTLTSGSENDHRESLSAYNHDCHCHRSGRSLSVNRINFFYLILISIIRHAGGGSTTFVGGRIHRRRCDGKECGDWREGRVHRWCYLTPYEIRCASWGGGDVVQARQRESRCGSDVTLLPTSRSRWGTKH